MKTIHKANKPKQFPQFWNEEWLEAAIRELDTRQMSPEKRMAYEMTISANALAVRNENKKIEEALEAKNVDTVTKALKGGKLTIEEIAEYTDVSIDFVLQVQKELASQK